MNEFNVVCYQGFVYAPGMCFDKGTIYTAKESTIYTPTGEIEESIEIKNKDELPPFPLSKEDFSNTFIDLRNPTIYDTIKYALAFKILEIVGDDSPFPNSYGCDGIRCHYHDKNNSAFDNEFYFTDYNSSFRITARQYFNEVKMDEAAKKIADTLIFMSEDNIDYIEAGIYLTGIKEQLCEISPELAVPLTAPLDEFIAKTVELENKNEQER